MYNLTHNGKSRCVIIVRSQATEPERFAADELQRYVRKVTRATLPIAADDGRRMDGLHLPALLLAATPMPPSPAAARALAPVAAVLNRRRAGSFAWQPVGQGLAIVGRDGHGLLTGTYDFIETALGVRFLAPGPEGEVIPRRTAVAMPAARKVREPAFRYRTLDMDMAGGIELADLDWYAKRGLNVLQTLPEVWERTQSRWEPEMLRKRGWQLMVGSHISNRFFPKPELYFKQHPEYYGLCGGRRVPDQICYSNPDAVRLMIGNMTDYFRAHPEIDLFAPWPNDGDADTFCHCARCRKVALRRQIFDVNRRILKAVRAINPRVLVLHLCYMPAAQRGPPPGTQPMPNQIPLYCPYVAKSKYHPIYDARYGRWWQDQARNHRAMCRDLRQWRRTHEVMIFTYNNDQIMRHRMYSPFPDVIQQELRYYRELGIIGIWDCLCGRPLVRWMDALNHYAYARLVWDPDVDLEALCRDFDHGYYGAAGETVFQIDREVAAFFRMPLPHGCQVDDIFWFYHAPWLNDYRPELENLAQRLAREQLDRIQALGARAVALARREQAIIRRRVERLAICLENQRREFEMAMAYMAFAWYQKRYEQAAAGPARKDASAAARAVFKNMEGLFAAYRRSLGRWQTLKPAAPGAERIIKRIELVRKLVEHCGRWCRASR